jgi:hypothetical protein
LACPPSGRLAARLGERWAERLRALAGRRPFLRQPGDEWPHCSGLATTQELAEIRQFAKAADSADVPLLRGHERA